MINRPAVWRGEDQDHVRRWPEHGRRPAFARAGLEYVPQDDGMHALRHLYASAQLEGSVSVKALSINLGHHDPGFTLRVYTHLMPSSVDKSGKAATALFKPKNRDDAAETA